MHGSEPDERLEARRRLILALDVPSVAEAERIAGELNEQVGVFKIGLELLFSGGANLAQRLTRDGARVFVDAKLLDIPNTVERATAQIAGLGANYLTIHAQDPKTLEAAVRGRGSSEMRLLGVTVLTHLTAGDLAAQGVGMTPEALALARSELAHEAGLNGVVCSPREAAQISQRLPAPFMIVTPGIRSAENTVAGDDQSRSASAYDAIRSGAHSIVVGRPILRAANPVAAATALVDEIATALADASGRS